MWSEHCSYKSSRVHLRKFPTTGPRVIQGPGENAGVVDIGDGLAVAFKMESHNHPSFIEPYQGAATGVGGILRDIFTMGARPIASLNSLRFGALDAPRMKHLVDGVVRGIAGYGNCIGIPTRRRRDDVPPRLRRQHPRQRHEPRRSCRRTGSSAAARRASATRSSTSARRPGRDGIHGATMASEEFAADEASQKRPTVQVGDPFTEKLLMEACLELFQTDAVVGIQDMGAAGLTSSSFEMAGRAGSGVEIDLSKVPVRETGMTPYEIMLSESQERMLLVARRDRLDEVLAHLPQVGARRGRDRPRDGLGPRRALLRGRDRRGPAGGAAGGRGARLRPPARRGRARRRAPLARRARAGELRRRRCATLLASPNVAEKSWIWTQYDHMVRTNTVERPGGDAAVVRVKGTKKAIAMKSDVNPFFCMLDPYRGGAIAVAEAARSVACTGARPLAITDCLNFGNPEKPEVMAQFEAAVRGITDACRALEIPVVSGNVSFYNETDGRAIPPTPTVGMVGLIEDVASHVRLPFRRDGDLVALLGATRDELGASEFLRTIRGRDEGPCPEVDLDRGAPARGPARDARREGPSRPRRTTSPTAASPSRSPSARCSEGRGAEIALSDGVRRSALLFGESTGRAVVVLRARARGRCREAREGAVVPLAVVGRVGGDRLRISVHGVMLIDEPVAELAHLWRTAFAHAIESADVL